MNWEEINLSEHLRKIEVAQALKGALAISELNNQKWLVQFPVMYESVFDTCLNFQVQTG